MATTGRTQVAGQEQEQSGSVTRALLNTVTAGSAVIAKLLVGVGLVMSQTGVDAGTGDVTIAGYANPPCGRLTLTSGVPVMTASVTAATTLYYTPYQTNGFPQWNGTTFLDGIFNESSQALNDTTKSPAAAVASMGYDVFGWYDSSTTPATFRATRGPAWTAGATAGTWTAGGGACSRGAGAGSTALTRTQGVLVNTYAITNGPAAGYGVYLGTVATDSSGATVSYTFGTAASGGGAAVFNVWNYYNRVSVATQVVDSNATLSAYSSKTVRALNASNGNRITFVTGVAEESWAARLIQIVQANAAGASCNLYIGLDSTTAYWSGSTTPYQYMATNSQYYTMYVDGVSQPQIGQHYFQALQSGDGTNNTTPQTGGANMMLMTTLKM